MGGSMKFILMIVGFTTGNFIAAYFGICDYSQAFDRSFFQAIAISYIGLSRATEQRRDDGKYCEYDYERR
jgi:hypothetical protein